MAVGRLPESGADLCSQPTISRLENLPGPIALKRMMAAMVEVFCDSFEQVPRRIVLDIDDTEDRVHGGQQLALFNAYYDSRCFQPIHIYEATTGKPVAIILRPGKTPDGAEVALVLRHVIGHIRARWPAVDIVVRGDSHYGRPEAMAWCERKRIGYIFGLAGNAVLLRRVGDLAEDAALGRSSSARARPTRSAATANSATPPQAGKSSAASSPASRPDPRGRQPLHRHQPGGPAQVALRLMPPTSSSGFGERILTPLPHRPHARTLAADRGGARAPPAPRGSLPAAPQHRACRRVLLHRRARSVPVRAPPDRELHHWLTL